MKPLLFLSFLLCCGIGHSQTVWPQPQTIITRNELYLIDPNDFDFIRDSRHDNHTQDCPIMSEAYQRYKKLMFDLKCPRDSSSRISTKSFITLPSETQVTVIRNITVVVRHCEYIPHGKMDEMYTLYIGKIQRTTLLFANTVWGGLRSLETVSQLVYPVLYQGKQFFALNGTFILDFPRFSYRGVMIDTSRHYIPVPVLKQNLDAMSYNKFNVFHWHLVDDQAFPYESTVFPELHQEGSYDSETHVYSTQDVQDIIEYSRIRGIRVIPEFDIPGHTLSWGKSQKNLLTKCFDSKTNTPDGTFGPIDPTKEENYDFLFRFFKEVKSVFPDEYLHLGGDEVDPACWKSSPVINQFMKDRQIKSYEELESFFIQKMYGKLQSLDKSYLFWQEVFDNQDKLDQETSVINVWKWYGERNWPEELQKVTTAGFRAVLSAPWYLNYIHYGPDWTTYYESDPHGFNGTERQKELILGGSACMWTEYVDGSGIMPRTWPRASAVAERLWSDANVKDTRRALPRIRRMQCLMQKRGLRVEPINGPSFCPCDHTYY